MAGRKRLPTELKIQRGTLRHSRSNDLEPKYPLVRTLPDPPDILQTVGRRIYLETGLNLINTGVLRTVHLYVLIAYCRETEIYLMANQKLNDTGFVGTVKEDGRKIIQINPFRKIANDAYTNLMSAARELGITPATSSKVYGLFKDEKKKDSVFD